MNTVSSSSSDKFNLVSAATNSSNATGAPVTLSNVRYYGNAGSFEFTTSNLYNNETFDMSKIKVDHFTVKGQNGATYTLSGTIIDGWVSSDNTMRIQVSETDRINLNGILNQVGGTAVDGTAFSFTATPGWVVGGNTQTSITASVNTLTSVAPVINYAQYNASTHVLDVSASFLVKTPGASNDITTSKLSLVGEGGISRTLSTSGNVEIIDESHFKITLSDADANAVSSIINKNGYNSTGGSAYNLVANDDWNSVVTGGNIADNSNSLYVTNLSSNINSASYNASTGVLTVTGTAINAGDNIDISKLSFTGEGGNIYQLTSAPVIASNNGFTVTLNAADKLNLNGVLDKNGSVAVSGTNFNLSAAANWDSTSAAVADTSNAVTVTGVQAPTITSATYDVNTHKLVVTGENFVKVPGANNDINTSKFYLGPWSTAKQLSSSGGVEIIDDKHFEVILSDADAALVRTVIDHDHEKASSSISYSLSAYDDWNGVVTGDSIADYQNPVTVSGVPVTLSNIKYYGNAGSFDFTTSNLYNFETFDMSKIKADHFTVKGQNGASYTLTGNITGGWVDSGNTMRIQVSELDRINLNGIMNQVGGTAVDGTAFSFTATPGWFVGGNTQASITTSVNTATSVAPVINYAQYNASTHVLDVSASFLVKTPGASNDITTSKLSLVGEGGISRTLSTSGNVEIIDESHFKITLSDADANAVSSIINKNGYNSTGGSAYNLVANDDWNSVVTGGNIADNSNSLYVTNLSSNINSASYNASTGVLTVTGTAINAGDNIDISKLSFTGEGGNIYQLTSAPVIASNNGFTVTLNATDKLNLNGVLDKNGSVAVSGTNFNLSAAANWDSTSAAVADTSNAVTVTGVQAPTITSATYDVNTHKLVVTGENFVKVPGANNDIDTSKLLLGPWNATKALSSSGKVEVIDNKHFEVILSDADAALVRTVIDHDHESSSGSISYNLSAYDDWNGVVTGDSIADYQSPVSVSGVPATLSNVTYYGGSFRITSTNLWNFTTFDMSRIKYDHFTFKGQNGASYTLSGNITGGSVDSGNTLSFQVPEQDRIALNGILNQNGNTSVDGVSYVFTATPGWYLDANTQATLTSGVLTASLPAPVINNASYNANTHVLDVNASFLVKTPGTNNDITVSKLSFVGEAGASYTLSSSNNVEITNENHFSVKLSDGDANALNAIINKNGGSSSGGATYNLVAADDWNSVVTGGNIADLTNYLSVSGVNAAPVLTTSSGNTLYLEGNNTTSKIILDPALTLTDPDSANLLSASVAITGNFHAGQDVLLFTNDSSMGNINASYDAAHGVMSLTSAGGSATVAQWQAALRSVSYSNSSDTPDTSNRIISFSARDITSSSAIANKTIQVTAVDDSPVIMTTNTVHPYIENQSGVVVDAGLSLKDADSATLASATLSMKDIGYYYAAGEDMLAFSNNHQNMGNITASAFDQATGVMTLVSAGATATVAEWQNALRSVQYVNLSEHPVSGNYRGVKFVVSDGHSDSYVASTPFTSYQILSVVSVNDAPVVHAPASLTVNEDQSSVLKGFSFNDADSLNSIVTATLSVSSGTLNASASANVTVTGSGSSTLKLDGQIDDINNFIAANKLNFTSALHNHSDVNLSLKIDDNGFWGSNTADHVHLTAEQTVTIKVNHINQAPVVTASTGNTSFVEGNNTPSTAVKIDPALGLLDADSSSLSSATVSISSNFHADQDQLTFKNDSSMGNINASYDAAHGVMALTSAGGSATVAQWQTALRSVSYTNSSESPDASTRNISFTAFDGSNTSAIANKQVTVTATNDAPLLHDVPGIVSLEGIKSLFSEVTVTDADGNYGTLSIQLATPKTGYFVESGIVSGNHYDAKTGLYQISGNLSNLETALHQLSFIPNEGFFSPGSGEDMLITMSITDSEHGSSVYTQTHIVAESGGKSSKVQAENVHTIDVSPHMVELVGVVQHDSVM